MPFGLCNSPTTFMRVMSDLFRPFLNHFVLVYLDDIHVYGRAWEEHMCHIKKVLDVLKKEKLYLKLSKCKLGKTSLIYLGHIIGNGKLRIDPSKVEAVMKWPKPTNVTEVLSFLGMVQYWRRFITKFSIIATHLTSVK